VHDNFVSKMGFQKYLDVPELECILSIFYITLRWMDLFKNLFYQSAIFSHMLEFGTSPKLPSSIANSTY